MSGGSLASDRETNGAGQEHDHKANDLSGPWYAIGPRIEPDSAKGHKPDSDCSKTPEESPDQCLTNSFQEQAGNTEDGSCDQSDDHGTRTLHLGG